MRPNPARTAVTLPLALPAGLPPGVYTLRAVGDGPGGRAQVTILR